MSLLPENTHGTLTVRGTLDAPPVVQPQLLRQRTAAQGRLSLS